MKSTRPKIDRVQHPNNTTNPSGKTLYSKSLYDPGKGVLERWLCLWRFPLTALMRPRAIRADNGPITTPMKSRRATCQGARR
jgi:hypothetical protein